MPGNLCLPSWRTDLWHDHFVQGVIWTREASKVCITRTELPQTARMSARTEFVACLDWL